MQRFLNSSVDHKHAGALVYLLHSLCSRMGIGSRRCLFSTAISRFASELGIAVCGDSRTTYNPLRGWWWGSTVHSFSSRLTINRFASENQASKWRSRPSWTCTRCWSTTFPEAWWTRRAEILTPSVLSCLSYESLWNDSLRFVSARLVIKCSWKTVMALCLVFCGNSNISRQERRVLNFPCQSSSRPAYSFSVSSKNKHFQSNLLLQKEVLCAFLPLERRKSNVY